MRGCLGLEIQQMAVPFDITSVVYTHRNSVFVFTLHNIMADDARLVGQVSNIRASAGQVGQRLLCVYTG